MRTRGLAVVVAATFGALGLMLLLGPWLLVLGWLPGGAPQELKVADAATLSVAGATLLLALFTAGLAWYTGQSVAEGRRERLIAERALEASWRPMIVDVPEGLFVSDQADLYGGRWDRGKVRVIEDIHARVVRFVVPVRNIGSGPAILRTAGIVPSSAGLPFTNAVFKTAVVPRDEMSPVLFELPIDGQTAPLADALTANGSVTVKISYDDQVGATGWRTDLRITRKDDESRVTRVSIFDSMGGVIVASGPWESGDPIGRGQSTNDELV